MRASRGSFLALITIFSSTMATASTPPAPMNCSSSPFGPADGNGYYTIPYSLSSLRHPYQSPSWVTENYINNTDYRWEMWFSGNVTGAKFDFQQGSGMGDPGFDTEYNYDFFYLSGSTTVSLTGNLDTNNTVEYVSPAASPSFSAGSDDNYLNMEWRSDYSMNYPGWTVKAVKVYCGRTNEAAATATNVSRLQGNSQRDGVLLGSGDIRYFVTVQKADRELWLHLKQDGPPTASTNHADYDLYASTSAVTTLPHPGTAGVDYQWVSARGSGTSMSEDTILIQPSGSDRYIYFAVYAYSLDTTHTGGYRVYDNTIGKEYTITAATGWDYRNYCLSSQVTCASDADCSSTCASGKCTTGVCYCPGSCVNTVYNAISQTTAGLYQATDGTGLARTWQIWNNVDPQNGCGGHRCDYYFASDVQDPSACGGPWGCNFNPDGSGYPQRIASLRQWNGAYVGTIAAHELGHCMYVNADEYCGGTGVNCGTGTGYVCGHSIMDGPASNNITDYCTNLSESCTTGPLSYYGNHGTDCYSAGTGVPSSSTGNWPGINTCDSAQVRDYYPIGIPQTPDPETWTGSDIWCASNSEHSCSYSPGYVTVTTMN